MKKILFAALFAVSLVSSAFAKDEKKVSLKVLNAFTAEFDEATDVNWTSTSNFNQAAFNLDGKQLQAFYSFTGDKIGVTQEVSFETIPLKAKKCIAKKYSGYSIKEVILFETEEGNAYYLSAENDLRSLILKVAYGHVSVFKKKNKS